MASFQASVAVESEHNAHTDTNECNQEGNDPSLVFVSMYESQESSCPDILLGHHLAQKTFTDAPRFKYDVHNGIIESTAREKVVVVVESDELNQYPLFDIKTERDDDCTLYSYEDNVHFTENTHTNESSVEEEKSAFSAAPHCRYHVWPMEPVGILSEELALFSNRSDDDQDEATVMKNNVIEPIMHTIYVSNTLASDKAHSHGKLDTGITPAISTKSSVDNTSHPKDSNIHDKKEKIKRLEVSRGKRAIKLMTSRKGRVPLINNATLEAHKRIVAENGEHLSKINQLEKAVQKLKHDKKAFEDANKASQEKIMTLHMKVDQLKTALQEAQDQASKSLQKADTMHQMFRDAALKIEVSLCPSVSFSSPALPAVWINWLCAHSCMHVGIGCGE
jgi:hypothetical protein